jgi:hypothetical protein
MAREDGCACRSIERDIASRACGIHIGLRSKPGGRRRGVLLPRGSPLEGYLN